MHPTLIHWRTALPAFVVLVQMGVAQSAPPPRTMHELTSPPVSSISVANKDYRLRTVHPSDAKGRAIVDVPATSVSVFDGMGAWEVVESSALPPFTRTIPADVRKGVQLFYASASGWMIVPRGWRMRQARVGADGGALFTFVAPAGVASGWLSREETPACIMCILGGAEGLFRGAHRQLDQMMGETTPTPVLSPKPDLFERLDSCTVRLVYRLPHSPPVRSIEFYWQKGDPSFSELVVALPKAESKVADFLLAAFADEKRDPACHPHRNQANRQPSTSTSNSRRQISPSRITRGTESASCRASASCKAGASSAERR